jgi:hypothetical protein
VREHTSPWACVVGQARVIGQNGAFWYAARGSMVGARAPVHAPAPSSLPRVDWLGRLGRYRGGGPFLVAFIACVWLNQSFGFFTWQRVRYAVFTHPGENILETVRYPFIFLYRRSADEAMYYGAAAQILGQPYDEEIYRTHSRGDVHGLTLFESPPPPADGRWHLPWTEVHLEYPPPAVPFILAPKLVTTGFEAYARVFGLLMGACMVASVALAIDALKRGKAPRDSRDARWWLASVLLLAEGALTIQRLDPIVALAMMAAVHGAVRRSPWQLGLFSGLAGACKLVPLLVLPVILAADWPNWRDRAVRLGGWVAIGFAVGFGPMLFASPAAVIDLLRYHGLRGLQIESTLGLLVGALRWTLGTARAATVSFGSFNLDGSLPDGLARTALPLTILGIAVLALREWRARVPDDEAGRIERVTCAALAATVALWLGGKVFSPQYLTWGIPLVLAIPGRRGVRAIWIAVLALTLTQLYHRGYYSSLIAQTFPGLFTALVRQAVLVALLAFVAVRAGAGVLASPQGRS